MTDPLPSEPGTGPEGLPYDPACDLLVAALRFRPARHPLDAAAARAAFRLRLELAGFPARPVVFLPDAAACVAAAFGAAWTEMVDRAAGYAATAAAEAARRIDWRKAPQAAVVAAAKAAVDREYFVDRRLRNFGPPYDAVSDEGRVSRSYMSRHADLREAEPDPAIGDRVRRILKRLLRPHYAAFHGLRDRFAAARPDAPDAVWRRAWDAAWWAEWDGPAADELRRLPAHSRSAVGEEAMAAAAAEACAAASSDAWSQSVAFAWTATIRSPVLAADDALWTVLSEVLNARAGHPTAARHRPFLETFIAPYRAGVFCYFITPAAILCAPHPALVATPHTS
jgi:hypothetical protein